MSCGHATGTLGHVGPVFLLIRALPLFFVCPFKCDDVVNVFVIAIIVEPENPCRLT